MNARWHRSARVGLVLVLLIVALASILIVEMTRTNPHAFGWTRHPGPLQHVILTPDHGEDYNLALHRQRITVSTRKSAYYKSLRIAFWKTGTPVSVDQQSCVVWLHPNGDTQPGMALRIDPGDRTHPARALIVTQNVYYSSIWYLHLLGMEQGEYATQNNFGKINAYNAMLGPDGKLSADPWHVCVRAIGRAVSLKAWPETGSEPAWTSQTGVWHLTVPQSWVYPGRAGAYAAHIKPGQTSEFANLTTTDLDT